MTKNQEWQIMRILLDFKLFQEITNFQITNKMDTGDQK